MKVTTDGQVTIPQEIRDQLGIFPGTDVEFSVDGNSIRLTAITKQTIRGTDFIDRMRGTANTGMTTDEIMALTRGED